MLFTFFGDCLKKASYKLGGVEGEACICHGVNVTIRVVEVALYF